MTVVDGISVRLRMCNFKQGFILPSPPTPSP